MNSSFEAFLAAVTTELGAEALVREPSIASAFAGDWSEAPKVTPSVVIFPRTPQQVAMVLRRCSEFGQQVVVQGGLTGLAGGATPRDSEVALSLSKLSGIESIDLVGGTATVQAGVVLETLQQSVEEQGWYFPLDLGARGSCQVGGNAAVNAGGNRVIRYGTMRDLVLGIEVALPDGRLLTMLNSVTKNTTGIDLKHLFIGSEGTLGVITRLVVKLFPKPEGSCTALCALSSFDAAARLIRLSRAALPTLSAFEVMWSDFMTAAQEVTALRPPFEQSYSLYVLIECLGGNESAERQALEAFLERAMEAAVVDDAIVAQSLDDAAGLWAYRESVGELLSQMKPHAAFDVSVPMASMETFVKSTRQRLGEAFPGQRHLFFGHIGDGNLHVLSGPHDSADLHRVEELVYSSVRRVGGAISAEHGIGIIKKEFLAYSRSPEELTLMAELKRLLDPHGTLNPGRIL
ncbi:FAD-binding oxidoreductase [Cupriavidus consociatus]|uniref:FAD-binding oxidoreductase n=1 Tax=Cupriavidus consociatus TaxID=2821357 RepID=UPI001AE2EBDF|nr:MULTISPECIES: FAD-binding oxidoreductase [unclassified Cupriavidus]MBP0618555.1 FAD-binding oxidoreductase [Cupriavidus sp. LEh25]MDK2655191.1 FAD-binding oxidoreductase [Cupriavidus sp. LEh21]